MSSSLLRVLRPSQTLRCRHIARGLASNVLASPAKSPKAKDVEPESLSSCTPNTLMPGLNWLKDQPPVLALPDSEYPPWLWTLLQKKVLPDDGPGGKAEKVRLRKERREAIRESNFLKTQ
ncbi:hypothetical protein JAAARDRAFT_200257 [Jaapia argillacea MUCL 33604]|uniref:Large ribosomal subunit protein mL54 n=1 Tax=Jaapia argillacea MUCL 33604 TaxID=933084 RepID=A0A067P5A4_9AGAM|nr:hypothetical protein JAAARDRAFT_200257 [Jaapia argillacea MUCL 33604]